MASRVASRAARSAVRSVVERVLRSYLSSRRQHLLASRAADDSQQPSLCPLAGILTGMEWSVLVKQPQHLAFEQLHIVDLSVNNTMATDECRCGKLPGKPVVSHRIGNTRWSASAPSLAFGW